MCHSCSAKQDDEVVYAWPSLFHKFVTEGRMDRLPPFDLDKTTTAPAEKKPADGR